MLQSDAAEKRINFRVSPKEINKKILIFIAIVLGTTLILRPLQLTLRNHMITARDNFIQVTEEITGLRIQYASMGPSIFGTMDIRNILLLREDDSVFLSMSRLRFSFSLFELIRGNPLAAFRSVSIDMPVLNLDLEKDTVLWERFAALNGPDRQENSYSVSVHQGLRNILALLPEGLSIRVRNGEWEFSDSIGSLKIQNVGFDASVRQNRLSFQGRWNAEASIATGSGLMYFVASDISPAFQATISSRFSGEYLADIGEGRATLTIQSAYTDLFSLRPLNVLFFLSGEQLEIRKAYGVSPASFSIVYDITNGSLQGRFEGENFSPSTMLELTGAWSGYNPLMDLRVSGSAGFERENSGQLHYFVNFVSTGFPQESQAIAAMPANHMFDALPAGYLNLLLEQSFLAINIAGNTNHVTINNFDIRSPFGRLRFVGGANIDTAGILPLSPYGTLSLSNFRLQGDSGVNGDIRLGTRGNEVSLFSDNFTAGDLIFPLIDLSLTLEEYGFGFVFSALSANFEEAYDIFPNGIVIEGSADYDPRRIRANLRLNSFPIGDIFGLIEPFAPLPPIIYPARAMADDILISTDMFFTTDFESVLYSIPRIVITHEGSQDVMAVATISGTHRGMELLSCYISWEGGLARFSGTFNYSDIDNISFSFGAVVQNMAYFFDGHIHDMRTVGIRGSHGFEASLSALETGSITGHVRGDSFPIPIGESLASLSFFVSLIFDSPTQWQAGIENFEISGLPTPASSSAFLSLSGTANESALTIPTLFFDDGRGVLQGTINLDWGAGFEYGYFLVNLAGHNRNEQYFLSGSYRDNRLELSLFGQGMQFARFSDQNAIVDGSLRLSWESQDSFSAEAAISSFAMHNQSGLIIASANVTVDNDMFLSEQIVIDYSGFELAIPFIRIDRSASLAETEVWGSGFLAGMPADISLHGNARFNSSATWLDLLRDFRYMNASVTVTNARYDTIRAEEPFDFSLSVSQEGSGHVVDLYGGPRNMLRFRYNSGEDDGIFVASLSAPSPVRGTLIGSLNSETIDARTNDLYVDMGALWRFIPPEVDFIAFPSGIVTGAIAIYGPLDDPRFYGTARGTSLEILIPPFLSEPIRTTPLTINLTGTEMTFGPVQAMVGQGGGVASGWFMFDRWVPSIFNIDINVPHEHPIPYDINISGVLATGLTSGSLVLAMEDFVFSVTGDLTAHNTAISVDANELMAAQNVPPPEDELVSVVVDLSIQADRRVEFFWPTMNFPVIRALADMGTGIRITADTAAHTYSLTGDVVLRGGEIFYLERNFYIREGVLVFRENESQFEPHISARAEIRERAGTGPVTISMIIDHAPLFSFSPRFVSTPPIPQREIYSLLGQMPHGEEGEGQTMLAASLALDGLAQFTVMRRVEREVRDFLGLDMFSVRTQLFQNMLLQAAGLETNPFNRPYRVGHYFDNSTIFLGRFFQADIFGEAMINFSYDDTRSNWGGMIVAPEFALEMRNPLFDIRLNVAPYNPGNMFIDDISISLIWRRSF